MIATIFELLYQKALGSSLLLLFIVVLRSGFFGQFNARAAYASWLIIPIFLVLPQGWLESHSITSGSSLFVAGSEYLPLLSLSSVEALSQQQLWFVILWLLGSIMSCSVYFLSYRRIKSSLRHCSPELEAAAVKIIDAITGSKKQGKTKINLTNLGTRSLKYRQIPQLACSSLIKVPAVVGLLRPYLILPENFLTLPQQSQSHILKHELYHLARRDHQVNFVRVLIKSLFWFNPLFYWADRRVEADQEMSCDAGVLVNASGKERKSYAQSLISSSLDFGNNQLISQWKYHSLIKERVSMLKNNNQKKWHAWVVVLAGIFSISTVSGLLVAKNDPQEIVPSRVIEPRYPSAAAENGVEGWVKLSLEVDEKGFVQKASVVDSNPKDTFDQVSLDAIKQWQFKVMDGGNYFYTMEFILGPPEDALKPVGN